MPSDTSKNVPSNNGFSLSLDAWAVIVAAALALVVKLGILRSVPW